MIAWQHGVAHSADCQIAYRHAGRGQAVVLLHGYTDSAACWELYAAQLVDSYTVIAYDARGHGTSSNPGRDYTNQANARDLAAVLDALAIEQPVLIGHSMGAWSAFAAAALLPDRIRAVVLEDPPLFDYVEPPREPGVPPPPHIAWMAELKTLSTSELVERCLRENPTWQAGEVLAWVGAKEAFATERQPDGPETMVPWRTVLPQVRCPALLITADPACGGAVDAATARECRALNPHVEVALIRGVGHSIRREAPDRYAAVVASFLGRV
ncbi:MAG: hypothetical protein RLZZ297_1244 [Chloroflexota bacterium]|jgi:pimeloyl-ACP methyl ester carboxylesterase